MATKKKPEKAGLDPLAAPAIPIDYKLSAYSKDEAQGVMIAVRQLPGHTIASGLLAKALTERVDRILMDFTAQGVAIRFRVDGVWEAMPPLDRAMGDSTLVVFKRMSGMNPTERRAKQVGKFGAVAAGTDWIIECMSQGVPTGERVLITIDPKKVVLKTLTDLGMREKMQESLKSYLNGNNGIAVISGPPGHGLPTTWRVALEAADKFVRDYVSFEDKADPDPEIINVTKNVIDLAGGQNPVQILEKALLKQPDCIIVSKFFPPTFMEMVLAEIQNHGKHAILKVGATDAADAIIQLITTYKKQVKDILGKLQVVLNQRLVRRLCEKCRQPLAPSPQLLQNLGIPAGRVRQLYQPFILPPPEQRVDAKGNPIEIPICPRCKGRGYYGRMAIFELLVVNDAIRKTILKNPTAEAIRTEALRQGHSSFKEECILAFALGHTSYQELQRMLQGK